MGGGAAGRGTGGRRNTKWPPVSLQRDLDRQMQRQVQQDYAMVQGFRTGMLRLCQAQLRTAQAGEEVYGLQGKAQLDNAQHPALSRRLPRPLAGGLPRGLGADQP